MQVLESFSIIVLFLFVGVDNDYIKDTSVGVNHCFRQSFVLTRGRRNKSRHKLLCDRQTNKYQGDHPIWWEKRGCERGECEN